MNDSKFGKAIRKINWYPPFLGMGIKVVSFSDDFRRFEVTLRAKWYNRNLFGTHFGGSLYTMSDPFFVFIMTTNLGRGYVVWDRSAAIEFKNPAKGTITGIFEVSEERINEIRDDVVAKGKNTYHFEAELKDADGQVVALVTKEVYVRKK